MVDVIHLKDKGIPLEIDGATRFVKGATKYTTFSDVIKMVLKKTGIRKEYRHLFTIYEVTSDAEKALPGKSRILKVIGSWRGEPNRLILRKTEPALDEKTKRWNLKKQSQNHLYKPRKGRQPNVQTASSQTELADKLYQNRLPENSSDEDMSCPNETIKSDTTTDSDSTMYEFLSNLDQSKLAGLINFFTAVAKHRSRKEANKGNHEHHYSESAENSPQKHSKSKRMKKRVSHSKIKSRENRGRLKESSDCHPKKMHSVTRVNFGFIDVEPRLHDSVYPISDICHTEGHQPSLRANSARILSARKRLLRSAQSSVNVLEEPDRSSGRGSSFSDSSTSGDEHIYTGSYHKQKQRMHYHELWGESSLSSSDSGHEGDSYTSANMDKLFVDKTGLNAVCRIQELSPSTTKTVAAEPLVMPSKKRLVDYSLTDDEMGNSDDDMQLLEFSPIYKDKNLNLTQNQGCFSINAGVDCETTYLLEDDTPENSISYLTTDTKGDYEANINVADYIKSIFGNKCANEDDEMNSFMKSMMSDDSSDEG